MTQTTEEAAQYLKLEQQRLTHVDVTEEEIKEMLQYPSDFGYRGDKDIGGTWSLGPTVLTRDSDVLTRANYKALEIALETDTEMGLISADDYILTSCSHWACGWVEHLSFLAVDKDEEPTTMCRWVMRWVGMLQEYPVADESLYSEMEWEESLKMLEDCILCSRHGGVMLTSVNLPDDHAAQIHAHIEDAIREDDAWPIDEIKAIALSLGWLACKACDGDGKVPSDVVVVIDSIADTNAAGIDDGYGTQKCKECNGTGAQKKAEV